MNRLDIERVRREMRWQPWIALATILVGTAAVAGIILAVSRVIR
jgi:hypothetical protein